MSTDRRPFDEVRAALSQAPAANPGEPAPTVRLDPTRASRTGVPEVILAERKSLTEVLSALRRQADLTGRAIASRCPSAMLDALPDALAPGYDVVVHEVCRGVVVAHPECRVAPTGGRIAVISAGTSDRPIAAEAALMAREMGVEVEEVFDVGVAGLHRLVAPLERAVANGVDAIVVAAGMDGALPSVVAGLVPVPVIGLPTSVGYGFGGQGTGALTSMLQSCAPGLVVVNIDNGIGAGATAALIANRVAAARAVGSRTPLPEERLDQRPDGDG
jgi:hypothetical protein